MFYKIFGKICHFISPSQTDLHHPTWIEAARDGKIEELLMLLTQHHQQAPSPTASQLFSGSMRSTPNAIDPLISQTIYEHLINSGCPLNKLKEGLDILEEAGYTKPSYLTDELVDSWGSFSGHERLASYKAKLDESNDPREHEACPTIITSDQAEPIALQLQPRVSSKHHIPSKRPSASESLSQLSNEPSNESSNESSSQSSSK